VLGAVLGGLAAIGLVVAAVTIGVAGAGGTARPAATGVLDASVTGPATAVTDQVGAAGQRRTLTYWTPRRRQGATAAALPGRPIRAARPAGTRTPAQPGRSQGSSNVTVPKGIPTATPFSGSPTTGALFYTTGGEGHFCTASVVDSTVGDLALTAAHCVYWNAFAANIEYVPGYHDGKQPYGAWPVAAITVASGWKVSHDPDLDFAFLTLATADGRQIQARTGGLTIGFTRWYGEKIEVIGHNDSDAEPIRCATKSFRFRSGQMEFYCHGFWTGTSGGPWILGYNAKHGTGTVFGVIGGYELGGDYEWASYSAYFGSAAKILYEQAERASAPHPTPSAPASPTSSASTSAPTSGAPPVLPSATATASDSASPTSTATASPGAAVSATTTPSPATPVPTGSISTAYRAPVLPG
jgi:V8-like Glu-specific endopeptidase